MARKYHWAVVVVAHPKNNIITINADAVEVNQNGDLLFSDLDRDYKYTYMFARGSWVTMWAGNVFDHGPIAYEEYNPGG